MYKRQVYAYIHNLQGDVVGILDSGGALVVEYKYDVWGKPLSTTGTLANTLGKRNPFRYRGYVFDKEIEMYWMRSRYYHPELHRFISADTYCGYAGHLLSHAIYVYCNNSPIGRIDEAGNSSIAIGVGVASTGGPAGWAVGGIIIRDRPKLCVNLPKV